MDLYSAARRYSRPYRFTADTIRKPLPISARGLIGDGNSAALVRVDGAIDWLCFPRFDSPSVFAALLDPERGGMTAVTPVAPAFESLQGYDPDTNVLETLFTVPEQGVVRLTDYMPWSDDPRASIHEVHRRIQCREGEIEIEAIFDPRFDYGRVQPELEVTAHGVRAHAGRASLVAVLGKGARWEPRPEGGMRARLRLRGGEQSWMVLSWDSPMPEPLASYRPFELMRTTRHAWREWARGLQYDGPWRHHVMRSALALKLMIYGPSGAMVAAPTTSLPEWLGGARNWDYRYAWSRDTALAIRAANRIGYVGEAREFFHFIRDALGTRPNLQVMYRIDGQRVLGEQELGHLRGFDDSRPVRIGNGAHDQLQLDTAGALVDAAYLYERRDGSLTLRAWRSLCRVIEDVCADWRKPDHGIWEPRVGVRHNVHSKVMSWVALERGSRLAGLFGDREAEQRWAQEAVKVHADVLEHGMDPGGRYFVSEYGGRDVDAALLQLPIHGFVSPRDPRSLATLDRVRERLGDGPFLYRYLAEDGLDGREGAFVLCGFWLADALAQAGRLEQAQEVFSAHAESSNHLGLLAEELDPATGALLGNFPQAFSHLGLINAAVRIDEGLKERDEGGSVLRAQETDPLG